MRALAWALAAYVAGTLPSPYVVARLAKRDDVIAQMRRRESPGDAHFLVARKLSGKLGILSIVMDILKGFVPALIARLAGEPASTLALVGVAAVAGHCFAPFLRVAGGRGLTTAAGAALVIVPKAMVLTGIISLVGTGARAGGLGTSIGFGLLPVFTLVFAYAAALFWMTLGIVGLIAARRLEGLADDRGSGVPVRKAVLGRLLFDLPAGRHR